MEPFIKWRDEWRLGIEALDDQHRILSNSLNQLVQTCQGSDTLTDDEKAKRRKVLGELLDDLYRKTSEHFSYEEALMQKEAYPGYAAHAREHVMLLAELKSTFAERLKSGCCNMDPDILKSLKSWFIVHVSSSDREFASYMQTREAAE